MRIVSSRADIQDNLKTLGGYLHSSNASDLSFARELIQNGRCFVVAGEGQGQVFGPSRFVGYKGNNRRRHARNHAKDGKETNREISKQLRGAPKQDALLERTYRALCHRLGISVRNFPRATRKYWRAP